MEATIRRPRTFRLPNYLLDDLQSLATRQHTSLSRLVESMLLDGAYNNHVPNATTRAAIEEARSGMNLNKVYTSAEELIQDILSEE